MMAGLRRLPNVQSIGRLTLAVARGSLEGDGTASSITDVVVGRTVIGALALVVVCIVLFVVIV